MGLLEQDRELASIAALLHGGGVLVVEGGAGIGKTSLLDEACRQVGDGGYEILRARGSELESGFAFGVVRQLFERRLATVDPNERDQLLEGPADAGRPLLLGAPTESPSHDVSSAADDAHWADPPSLRWLAYLAPRLEGLALALLMTLLLAESASTEAALLVVRAEAGSVARPGLLSLSAVTTE